MRVILAISVVLAAALYICTPVVDPDLWWHIVVGRWVLNNFALPVSNIWTVLGDGMPWRAYSWALEVVFAWTDSSFGIEGLLTLKVLLAALIGASFVLTFIRLSRNHTFGVLLGAIALIAQVSHFTLRPQSLIWALFSCAILLGDELRERGRHKGILTAVFLLFCIWSNCHLSAVFGLIALGAWAFRSRSELKTPLFAVFVGSLGTLCTPYMGGEWLTMFETASHPTTYVSVVEFAPATITQYSTAFLLLPLALITVLVSTFPRLFDLPRIVMVLGFAVAGLAVVKYLPFSTVSAFALLALIWRRKSETGSNSSNLIVAIEKLLSLVNRIPTQGLTFLLLSYSVLRVSQLMQYPLNEQITPRAATDFLLAHNLPGPYLNTFGSGGYLLYRLSDATGVPRDKVALDGRTNLIKPEDWQIIASTLNGREGWDRVLQRTNPTTILWSRESPFCSLLRLVPGWCEVFRSGTAERGFSVFVKSFLAKSRADEFPGAKCSTDFPETH